MPRSVLRTVAISGARIRAAPGRRTDLEHGRERKYLTPDEVDRLVAGAKKRGRYGRCDALAVLMCYRHGLRVSELVALRWAQIDWPTPRITIQRRKGSISGVAHRLLPDEVRALKALRREQPEGGPFIFTGERGPVTVAWFQRLLQCVGAEAGLPAAHPHQLRHACGFALADKGRDLREIQLHLGHKAISNTTQYVELRPGRLDRIWE
jgi:type 1 fimbriae regulatory protein FimB/type 1 fimbriae regulatory protein FimE